MKLEGFEDGTEIPRHWLELKVNLAAADSVVQRCDGVARRRVLVPYRGVVAHR